MPEPLTRPGDDPDIGATPWPVVEVRPASVTRDVQAYLDGWGAATVQQLVRSTGHSRNAVRGALERMHAAGRVDRRRIEQRRPAGQSGPRMVWLWWLT